jgi:predicted dehydrogenase
MKVAIVGFGRMGRTHLTAARNLGLEVIAICDPRTNKEDLHDFGRDIVLFQNIDELLQSSVPDVGIIAATANSHFEIASKMITKGVKYILCEKPLVTSMADNYELSKILATSNSKFAVNHQMRYMNQYQVVRDLAKRHELGILRSMTVCGSNFGLAMNGTHYFEAFSWLTQSRIEQVTAWLDKEVRRNPRGAEFKDQSGQLFAKNDSDQRLYMDLGGDLGHEIIVNYAFRDGHITVNELQGTGSISIREQKYRIEKTERYGMPSLSYNFEFEPTDTIQATQMTLNELLFGTDFPSILNGIHSTSVAFAAIKSDSLGSMPIFLSSLTESEVSQFWA